MLSRARANALTSARDGLPAVTRAHQALAVDKAVADPATVVRALVGHDHEPAAPETRDRDRPGAIARGHDGAARQVDRQSGMTNANLLLAHQALA